MAAVAANLKGQTAVCLLAIPPQEVKEWNLCISPELEMIFQIVWVQVRSEILEILSKRYFVVNFPSSEVEN